MVLCFSYCARLLLVMSSCHGEGDLLHTVLAFSTLDLDESSLLHEE